MPGNPNPSPATRFQPGVSGNPSGRSTEAQLRDQETANLASMFRKSVLSSLQEKIGAGADALELLTPEVIRVLKDSEDRAHGTPKQAIQHGSDPDNPMPPTMIVIEAASV